MKINGIVDEMQQKSYVTHSPEETAERSKRFVTVLRPRDVVLLKGDLGTGKSTFVRALVQALCGEKTEVPSPTFTLVQTYTAPTFTLWHFDLYRLKHSQEIYELGIEEAYADGVSLIEWPERLGSLRPSGALEIEFTYGNDENERILSFKGWGDRLL